MSLSTAERIFLCAGIIDFGGMFIWFGVALHLAYTRLEEILESLKNSSAIVRRAPLRFGGPLGKLLLIGGISGIVTFPRLYLKHGGVSAEDLNALSPRLKRKLATMQWTLWGLIVLMVLLFLYGRYIGAIQ